MLTDPWSIQTIPTSLHWFVSLLHKTKLKTQMKQRYPSYYRKKKIIITANKQQNVINKTGKKKTGARQRGGGGARKGKGFIVLGLEKGRWWMHWIVNDGKKNGRARRETETMWLETGQISHLLRHKWRFLVVVVSFVVYLVDDLYVVCQKKERKEEMGGGWDGRWWR